MTEVEIQQTQNSNNYFNELLQKKSKASSKAQQYVAIKNVSISQKLVNGDELISDKKAQIKILRESKNEPELQKRKIKQIMDEKDRIQKKIICIQNQLSHSRLSAQQQKPNSTKFISNQQRLKFVKEKIKQNKILAKRKEQKLKKDQQKQKQLRIKQLEEQAKKAEQTKLKKLEQTKKKIQQIQKRKQQRITQNKKANQIFKQKSKQKILAQKINQRFLSNQNILLDQRKKKLAQLRQFHKPMNRQQIDEHMRKFQKSKLQHSRNKQTKKLNSSSDKINLYYRSMFYDMIQRQRKQKQQRQIQQHQQIKQLKQKSKKYAKQIKVNFKPEIDEQKRKEIEQRIKSSYLVQNKNLDSKLKGIEYLQFAKQYANKHKKQENQLIHEKMLMREQAGNTRHTDYLAQFRKGNDESRLKRSVSSAQDFIKNVQKKNISSREKQQKIIQFAQNLQRKAREKQRGIRIGLGHDVNEEVDKLYISAIQAKLRALQP